MKIEERLHDAMHEYADSIEPEPGSWSRIVDRFDEEPAPRAPRRGALVFAGVALALVIALVAVLVVRDDDSTRVSTGPDDGAVAAGRGGSVAVIDRNRVVLIDGQTGSVQRELFSHPGIESVTTAIDGKSVYVITNDPGPCRGGPETFLVPLDGGKPRNLNLTGVSSLRDLSTTLIAYTGAINCSDYGRVIGYRSLTGPVAGGPPETRLWGDATAVSILDASPDGRALLVRVVRPGGATLSIIDDFSGSVTTVPGTESVTVAAFSGDERNAFLQIVRELGARTRLELIDREGHILSAFLVPAGSLSISTEPLRLLGVTQDGRAFQWRADGQRLSYLDVSGRITVAAWLPDAPAPAPASVDRPGSLVAAVDGNRLAFLASLNGSEQTSYGSFPGISSVSVTPSGKEIVFSYLGQGGGCGDQPAPEVDRLNVDTLAATPIVGGAVTPVVSPDGKFVAYGITCDGPALGLTNLATGANYRTDPLGGTKRETSANIESVEVLGWSPESTRMLYRLLLKGDSYPHYYVGRLWPAVPQSETKVVELPSGSNVSTAAFVDDDTVALAVVKTADRTVVYKMPIEQGVKPGSSDGGIKWNNQSLLVTGDGMFEAPGPITSLVADPSGRHFLALVTRPPNSPGAREPDGELSVPVEYWGSGADQDRGQRHSGGLGAVVGAGRGPVTALGGPGSIR